MSSVTTYLDLQTRVLELLSKSDATTTNRIKNWINIGYLNFVNRELWPFREVTSSFATVAGTQEYVLTTDFTDIDNQNIIGVTLQGSTNKRLTYVPFNQLRVKYPDFTQEGNGEPVYYYILAGKIGLWPTPGSVYTVQVDYYKVPTELSADSDVPIIPVAYRFALVEYALSKEHDFNTDSDLAQKAMNEYEQIVALARQNLLSQPVDSGNFVIQGPHNFVSHTGLYGSEVR